MYNYYFAAASQSFFLYQEPIEEILRERTQYYNSNNKEIDFWFVLNMKFLNTSLNANQSFNLPDSFAAIISLDEKFIQWLKLRVSFVHTGSFKSQSLFIPE
uniref:Ycf54 n=1 Tax=Cliftonaea pectinata TaxID=2007206 RepID=A0A1Z1MPW2_9FLOR|nr:hypothetical protein [Cliftonaea pectinata]ARW68127.1 hypothetical protein [Cliftonaea pectinata]